MAERESEEIEVEDLALNSIIGFDGTIVRGFHVHPDGQHVVYPLGNKVSIQHWETKKQDFLTGHTNTISAIDVSISGKYIASGQINHIGFKAKVILWDFETRSILAVHEHHKVRVEAVSFSISDRYVISLGGRDCGSVVIWDIETNSALCGNQASSGIQGDAYVVRRMNKREACFITGGDYNLQIWKIDRDARNVRGNNVSLSKLKRVILCIDINERDEICYCGTSTGDVLKVRLNFHHDLDILEPVKKPLMMGAFSKISNKRLPEGMVDLYTLGVRSILIMSNGNLIIGGGDGSVDIVQEKKVNLKKPLTIAYKLYSCPELLVLQSTKVKGGVTSLNLFKQDQLLVGTTNCELFQIDLKTMQTVLLLTCHTSTIYDIAFPYKFSDVFATASKDDVRVWSVSTQIELLRICVPNFICSKIVFAHDGKSIITAWNDGIIRAFTPLTGRLIYAILNAHNKGVSALATTHHGKILISGGCEGQVRLWKVTPYHHELMCTLKEHKGPVSAIDINATDDEAVSASTDGTCIIWDMIRQVRKAILFANTLFMCVKYYPTGVQIVTAGSDRKVCYWEVLDGSLVRELEGSSAGAINCLSINHTGSFFVTGGNDQIIKLWRYQEGITTHIGLGHSAVITASEFSPNGKFIISTSASGSIFIWDVPFVEEPPELLGLEEPRVEEQSGLVEHIAELESAKSSTDRKCCGCPVSKGADTVSVRSKGSERSNDSKASLLPNRGSVQNNQNGDSKFRNGQNGRPSPKSSNGNGTPTSQDKTVKTNGRNGNGKTNGSGTKLNGGNGVSGNGTTDQQTKVQDRADQMSGDTVHQSGEEKVVKTNVPNETGKPNQQQGQDREVNFNPEGGWGGGNGQAKSGQVKSGRQNGNTTNAGNKQTGNGQNRQVNFNPAGGWGN